MAEAKPANYEELIAQIEQFEKTIKQLETNVAALKAKLLESKEKYGTDLAKWPKS
jgi:hypothetical protein